MFNRQRKQPVDKRALLEFARALSARLSIPSGFSVVLISDTVMRRFHRDYAGKDTATDVLSFLADPRDPTAEEGYLGDILISVETAERQKRQNLEQELKLLTLHGVLHLLGFDHEVDRGRMKRLENGLKREFALD